MYHNIEILVIIINSGTSYRSISHVGTNSYTEYFMTYTTERYCCAGYAEQRGSCER